MSRQTIQTHELRHPETGHKVFADIGSRSFIHFLSLGYSYPEPNATGTIEFRPKPFDFQDHGLASASVDPAVSAVVASAQRKPRARSKAKPEAENGNDNH